MYCLKLGMFGERFLYSLVNESISLFFFFLVITSGTNLLLAWVAQPAKEKNVQRLTWTDLASKEFECKKRTGLIL